MTDELQREVESSAEVERYLKEFHICLQELCRSLNGS